MLPAAELGLQVTSAGGNRGKGRETGEDCTGSPPDALRSASILRWPLSEATGGTGWDSSGNFSATEVL